MTRVPFSVEAEIPLPGSASAARRLCWSTASARAKAGKPARTHWDMLLERRSIAELEVLLDERLALLRAGSATHRRSA